MSVALSLVRDFALMAAFAVVVVAVADPILNWGCRPRTRKQ